MQEPYTHLPGVRRSASKHFLCLLFILASLEGGNSISSGDRPQLIRRVRKQNNSNLNTSLKIEVSAFGIANQSLHKTDEKQAAATVLRDPQSSGVQNRIIPADSTLKIEVHQDPAAAHRVQNRSTPPAALLAATAAQPVTAAAPATPDVALASPDTAARGAVAPARADATTDAEAPVGAWLSGPIVSVLILGCLLYRCFWSDDTDTTDAASTARRASLDAAAMAFTQRRPSAFAANTNKDPSHEQDATRSSKKYRRESRDTGEQRSPTHSGSRPPDSPNMTRGSLDTPNMRRDRGSVDTANAKRGSSYRDRRRMSAGSNLKGESEASQADDQSTAAMGRQSSYRNRREASRGREPRRASSVAREASATRGQAQSREPSASRATAEPNNEEF